ncbi:aldo/keto reductase [Halobacillus salinarum]|uniref:Aldo/keto reductase n=1 Tax=Halobacillus salinarum TaxID=2932257 RepID=A0ABY4EEJ0_9BACI|nr:aldo/keto reductase [Halobacillus salinarum]UOQ42885.1 aldo/keto reductase [Halobacillus salinarum]
MNHINTAVTLSNGVQMPWVGLGVFKVEEGAELIHAVTSAIRHGYRSIDTASIYGNEQGVGEGIRNGMQQAGIKREDLFITSKVWNDDLGYESTLKAFENSLEKLQLEYLDLYLIHWPVEDKFKEAWKALETLYKQGKVKAIGVSNFHIHHLEELMMHAEIKPMVNQVERHPRLNQQKLYDFCKTSGIQIEAWSPLMQGEILQQEDLVDIARKYKKTTAQIILRWHLQNEVIVIPKSTKETRIVENSDVFDFELTSTDMDHIDRMNQNFRVGPDPDNFDF